jgi:hypothetical protein
MVISNPKRRSLYSGVVHCIAILLFLPVMGLVNVADAQLSMRANI